MHHKNVIQQQLPVSGQKDGHGTEVGAHIEQIVSDQRQFDAVGVLIDRPRMSGKDGPVIVNVVVVDDYHLLTLAQSFVRPHVHAAGVRGAGDEIADFIVSNQEPSALRRYAAVADIIERIAPYHHVVAYGPYPPTRLLYDTNLAELIVCDGIAVANGDNAGAAGIFDCVPANENLRPIPNIHAM